MIWGYPKNDLGTLHLVGNLTHPPVGFFLTTAIAEISPEYVVMQFYRRHLKLPQVRISPAYRNIYIYTYIYSCIYIYTHTQLYIYVYTYHCVLLNVCVSNLAPHHNLKAQTRPLGSMNNTLHTSAPEVVGLTPGFHWVPLASTRCLLCTIWL